MSKYLNPYETAIETSKKCIIKSEMKTREIIILGILGGFFISLGAHASIVASQSLGKIDEGLMKFMAAAIFPVGLMFIVIAGGELFTSNNMITFAFIEKKIKFKRLIRNWIIVYFSNYAGALLLALAITFGGMYTLGNGYNQSGELLIKIAEKKIHLNFMEALLRGILCNIVVVISVWMATSAQDIVSKITACWFPIMLFVLSGFEHSVANMYYLHAADMINGNIQILDALIKNLIPVTIGNIIGGGIIVPFMFYFAIYKKSKSQEVEKLEG